MPEPAASDAPGTPARPTSPTSPGPIRAAGAVLWRPGPAGPEVALIHRPRYDDWSFPKGKVKNGEHVLRAAVREVYEETAVRPVLGRRLPTLCYPRDDRDKSVDYWAATGADGEFVASDEVDRMEWLPLPAAQRRLTYQRDAELLAEFAIGPVRTTPYVILRHASAGEKATWQDDDLLRPLDARGRADASELAVLLAGFGPARVVSSATARCLETMLPFAALTGEVICTDTAFTLGASKGAGDRLAALLSEEVPTAVCTHGELVREALTRAYEELGAAPLEKPSLRKGEFWVLHVADGTLAAAERHSVR